MHVKIFSNVKHKFFFCNSDVLLKCMKYTCIGNIICDFTQYIRVPQSFPGGQSAAEFSSNPDQTHLSVIF